MARTPPDTTQRVGAARVRLTESARALLEAVVVAEVDGDEATLAAAADALDEVTTRLHALAAPSAAVRYRQNRHYGSYLPRSLLVGLAHPLSPAGDHSFTDGVLEVRVRFGRAYEGPPGYVHGGIVALAFDELFGMCNVLSGLGGLTGRLSVRYRKPTPLEDELRMTAWVEHHEGRRLRTRGTIHAGTVLTAEAEGLFVMLTPTTATEYFGDHG